MTIWSNFDDDDDDDDDDDGNGHHFVQFAHHYNVCAGSTGQMKFSYVPARSATPLYFVEANVVCDQPRR